MRKHIALLAALLALAAGCTQEIDPSSVTLNKHDLTLNIGGTAKLEATVEPANATNTALSWSSTAPDVASVDGNGIVTAVGEGQTVVTVATLAGGKTDACVVYVSKAFVPVTGVKLAETKLELKEGDDYALTAIIEPEDASNTGLTWSSSNPDVASVGSGGYVQALSGGSTVITVKTDDGDFTASCDVTVQGIVDAQSIAISPSPLELAEGTTAQLTATVQPAGASQEVQWAALNTSIVTVSSSGLVTGISEGTTKVFARSIDYPDVQGECEVTVIKDPTLKGISVNPSELTLTVGQTQVLQVLYTPDYAANKKVSWKTDNSSVASVSAEGLVTAIAEGTVTVTATSAEGGFTASCKVTVSKKAGSRVYYYYSGSELWVNGQPDPLSGAYDEESFKFNFICDMCPEGSDLYSLESYYDYFMNDYLYYLCRNREPLYKVNLQQASDDISCMSVRGGKAALVFSNNAHTNNYVIIVNPDGTSVSSKIPSDYVANDITCAVSPSGDVYLAVVYIDSFDTRHLVLFKYGQDGQWSENELRNDSPYRGYVQISDSGDIYVLTTESNDGYKALLYKNQEGPTVYYQSKHYFQHAFCVAGGHVHTAVIEFGEAESTITERRDGNVVRTYAAGANQQFGLRNRSIQVTSSGDSYVMTDNYVFKNGSVLYTCPDGWLDNFCVVE
ncbi:MAG: Ig-like domain-containing protein [Bacteroidales bacterium]|nr:Ig-like domain-containing protein [Bacteroidales bacterium]